MKLKLRLTSFLFCDRFILMLLPSCRQTAEITGPMAGSDRKQQQQQVRVKNTCVQEHCGNIQCAEEEPTLGFCLLLKSRLQTPTGLTSSDQLLGQLFMFPVGFLIKHFTFFQ
ncbi:hypothetical protein XENORESO_020950 [Xenotaenia resolanae]|uniref:Secreted protein n=1 Tax=Xenotaenia resolanae TaxID=208358 RepID=A0ABV0VS20_9TELE